MLITSIEAAVEAGIPVVRDLRAEAVLPVRGVTHDLRSTVRKLHPVFAADDLAVADGVVRVIVAESVLLHGIIEVERHTRFVMMMVVLKRSRSVKELNSWNGVAFSFAFSLPYPFVPQENVSERLRTIIDVKNKQVVFLVLNFSLIKKFGISLHTL